MGKLDALYFAILGFCVPGLCVVGVGSFFVCMNPAVAIGCAVLAFCIFVSGGIHLLSRKVAVPSAIAVTLLGFAIARGHDPSEPFDRVYQQIHQGMAVEDVDRVIASQFPTDGPYGQPAKYIDATHVSYRLNRRNIFQDILEFSIAIDPAKGTVIQVFREYD